MNIIFEITDKRGNIVIKCVHSRKDAVSTARGLLNNKDLFNVCVTASSDKFNLQSQRGYEYFGICRKKAL